MTTTESSIRETQEALDRSREQSAEQLKTISETQVCLSVSVSVSVSASVSASASVAVAVSASASASASRSILSVVTVSISISISSLHAAPSLPPLTFSLRWRFLEPRAT